MATDLPSYTNDSFKYTLPPNPSFHYGQSVDSTPQGKEWVEGEKDGWKVIDTSKEDPLKVVRKLIVLNAPSVFSFWGGIVSSHDQRNHSSSSGIRLLNCGRRNGEPRLIQVSAYPPVVSVSVSNHPNKGFTNKDTSRNIKATKQFTVNIISEAWVANANVCSIDTPPEVSEWPISGLTKEPSLHVKPARVKESAFSMECELFQVHDIVHPSNGLATTVLILGHVKYIHVRKDMLNERGNVDPGKLKPVGRLGDILFASVGGGYRIPRPVWKDESEKVLAVNKEKDASGKAESNL